MAEQKIDLFLVLFYQDKRRIYKLYKKQLEFDTGIFLLDVWILHS